jgi:hypothetical protein
MRARDRTRKGRSTPAFHLHTLEASFDCVIEASYTSYPHAMHAVQGAALRHLAYTDALVYEVPFKVS